MELLDGRKVADSLLENLKVEVKRLKEKGVHPHLTVILVGNDPASGVYVRNKEKACEKLGVSHETLVYVPEKITTEGLIEKIHELNEDPRVTGILVQLPLPGHIYAPDVTKAIDPKKDVDGFTAYNLGKMLLSTEFEDLPPCTALGVIRLLDYYNIDVTGKNATVIGASNISGKPIASMLLNRRATVTVCHSKTRDLKSHTQNADIVVSAVGKPKLITADMVKDGVIVIDVGINKLKNGTICGDCDFEKISEKASFITPVPGGVGRMTVACLMENIVRAAKRQNSIN